MPAHVTEPLDCHRQTVEVGGAREDWLMVLSLAPDSPAAGAARSNLEKMDVRKP